MLRLSVTQTWSSNESTPRTLDIQSPEWRELRQKVLERDNYQCNFCSVRASKHLRCCHVDGNASNNELTNLQTCCPMCDTVRRCGLAGMRNQLSLGLSSMSQKEINLRTLVLFEKTGKVPSFSDVDPNAVLLSDRTTSYANDLLQLEDDFDYSTECDCSPLVPHTYDMHRGFFKYGALSMLINLNEYRMV